MSIGSGRLSRAPPGAVGRRCSSSRSDRTAGSSGPSATRAGWSCLRGSPRAPQPGTPMRDANSCGLSPERLEQQPDLARDFGTLVGLQVVPGAVENFRQCFRNSIRPCRLQHLLDLAGGSAVRVTLDGDDDALPNRQVVGFQRFAGSRPSARTPPAGRQRTGGVRACGAPVGMRAVAASRRASTVTVTSPPPASRPPPKGSAP